MEGGVWVCFQMSKRCRANRISTWSAKWRYSKWSTRHHVASIEDPFDATTNCAQYVTPQGLSLIQHRFQEANKIIKRLQPYILSPLNSGMSRNRKMHLQQSCQVGRTLAPILCQFQKETSGLAQLCIEICGACRRTWSSVWVNSSSRRPAELAKIYAYFAHYIAPS
jgi:hypothetical protein